MYRIKLTARARREVKDIKTQYQQALEEAFEEIKDDPRIGKPLERELTGRLSYKLGPFRIIYTINESDKIIQVITAGHRSKVYK